MGIVSSYVGIFLFKGPCWKREIQAKIEFCQYIWHVEIPVLASPEECMLLQGCYYMGWLSCSCFKFPSVGISCCRPHRWCLIENRFNSSPTLWRKDNATSYTSPCICIGTISVNVFVIIRCSCYPRKRFEECSDGSKIGVAGTLCQLQNMKLSTQPITSFDWNADKMGLAVCSGLDQTVRVVIVTKLNRI